MRRKNLTGCNDLHRWDIKTTKKIKIKASDYIRESNEESQRRYYFDVKANSYESHYLAIAKPFVYKM